MPPKFRGPGFYFVLSSLIGTIAALGFSLFTSFHSKDGSPPNPPLIKAQAEPVRVKVQPIPVIEAESKPVLNPSPIEPPPKVGKTFVLQSPPGGSKEQASSSDKLVIAEVRPSALRNRPFDDRFHGGLLRDLDLDRPLDTQMESAGVIVKDMKDGDAKAWELLAFRGQAVQSLPSGLLVLSAPSQMRVDDKVVVHANVGVNVSVDKLKEAVEANSQVRVSNLKVSAEMVATLDGGEFKIVSRDPEQQSIAAGLPTVWRWDVTALKSGEHQLTASLFVIVTDTEKRRYRVDSHSQKIAVNVRDLGWAEWIASLAPSFDSATKTIAALTAFLTAVVGVGGFLLARFKRKKRKKPSRKRGAPAGPRPNPA